ncbi:MULTISPECIES: hypothetical protein [unclassified Imperialibacter]|uniref:hypothetical protein n=1 Tax=unclassified Imperialibacter TaxID=2629706 RepID=UPI001259C1A7|nr:MULTISPECIES: hypothetical protein [unclassified Imperialibacter]CAD5279127.1 conserved hypothetical protein [Imperialibacter sp. 75]CAD5289099.1 conserved hypothetical protein [Imperialibacter sp. 89]VVT16444.1 conserved hypothetical protein [Imperialibacter sp. EC-SDR9]
MPLKVYLLILLLPFSHLCRGQIEVDTSFRSISLKLTLDDGFRSLTFRKNGESDTAIFLNYFVSKNTQGKTNLSDEIPNIRTLWDSAAQLIPIRLTSANIGYPLEYDDVLQNQIAAFNASSEWKAHVNKNGKKLDYKLIRQVMIDHHVYGPFEDLLSDYGYTLTDLSTEKHGFVTNEKLKELGRSPDEVIPVPYMVWLAISIQ